jgi:hypothetical protein
MNDSDSATLEARISKMVAPGSNQRLTFTQGNPRPKNQRDASQQSKYQSNVASVRNSQHRTLSKETNNSTYYTKRSTNEVKVREMNIQIEEPCIIGKFDEGTNSRDMLKLPPMPTSTKIQKPLASFIPAPDRSKSIELN